MRADEFDAFAALLSHIVQFAQPVVLLLLAWADGRVARLKSRVRSVAIIPNVHLKPEVVSKWNDSMEDFVVPDEPRCHYNYQGECRDCRLQAVPLTPLVQ